MCKVRRSVKGAGSQGDNTHGGSGLGLSGAAALGFVPASSSSVFAAAAAARAGKVLPAGLTWGRFNRTVTDQHVPSISQLWHPPCLQWCSAATQHGPYWCLPDGKPGAHGQDTDRGSGISSA
jgi:hypothetical protein